MVTRIISLLSFAWLTLATGAAINVPCNVPSTYATIQAAIDDTNCSEIIVAAGTFGSAVMVDRSLTIRGGSPATTQIEATITVTNNATLTLEDVTVRGVVGAGVLLNSGSAELVASNITLAENGTGIAYSAAASGSRVTLSDCVIEYNGLGLQTRNLDMTNCAVRYNTPNGGIHALGSGGTIRSSEIVSNSVTTAAGDGGGILIDGVRPICASNPQPSPTTCQLAMPTAATRLMVAGSWCETAIYN